jgi:protein translocase SecG subunit
MYLDIAQLVLSFLLIGLVILQQGETGLYSATSNINRTRRGVDKFIFRLTFVVIVAMVGVAIANFII